jgi:CheY-like chemotaxis protein
MDLHPGANIWATSDGEGQGCEFNIDLPLVMAELDVLSLDDSRMDSRINSRVNLTKIETLNSRSNDKTLTIDLNSSSNDRIVNWSSKSPEITKRFNIENAHSLRILVVDDSKANRKMLLKMLRMCGHEGTGAEDGLEAVKEISLMMRKAKSRKEVDEAESPVVLIQYDVVLMDYCMPRMDGPQASINIRAMGFKGPIIGITGNPVEDCSEFISAGTYTTVLLILSDPYLTL